MASNSIRIVSTASAQSTLGTTTPTAAQLEGLANIALNPQPKLPEIHEVPVDGYTASGLPIRQGNPYVVLQQETMYDSEATSWYNLAGGTGRTVFSQAVYARLKLDPSGYKWWSGIAQRDEAPQYKGGYWSLKLTITNLEQIV